MEDTFNAKKWKCVHKRKDTMTKRTCPWCGGQNLILRNVSGMDPKRQNASYHYWDDPECGYSEKTSTTEYHDYKTGKTIECEREIISVHKPRAPIPAYQQPEYLRNGALTKDVPLGQITLGAEG